MMIVEFQGGLGNQMFQYAFYKALKTKYPSVKIKADLSNYERYKYHYGFEILRIFNINIDIATKWECIKFDRKIRLFNHQGFIKKALNKIWFILFPIISKCIKSQFVYINQWEEPSKYDPECFNLDIKNDYYLSGYWQNELYFLNIKDTLISDFQFNESFNHSIIIDMANCESVSIHIRRGDYINSSFDVLTMDYYKRAINYISSNINTPFFYIFSDDINYAKKAFDFLTNKYFISENQGDNSYKDMLFMSKCKHNIIANSSFSFWGAYLNRNKNKIIIAPDVHFKETKNYLYCIDWIIIDCKLAACNPHTLHRLTVCLP